MKTAQILESLDRRILHGLSCEWDAALWTVNAELRKKMRKPLFALRDFKNRLGYWSSEKREIGLQPAVCLESFLERYPRRAFA